MWNDALDAPIASDGEAVLVGHIASRAQAERWQAKGYDIAQAAGRYRVFLGQWEAAADEEAANDLADRFYDAEADELRYVGVSDADTDFYRVVTAAKHHEWA